MRSLWRQYKTCLQYRGLRCTRLCCLLMWQWICFIIGIGGQPLSLTAALQTRLSHLLEEHRSLLENANQPEVYNTALHHILKQYYVCAICDM